MPGGSQVLPDTVPGAELGGSGKVKDDSKKAMAKEVAKQKSKEKVKNKKWQRKAKKVNKDQF